MRNETSISSTAASAPDAREILRERARALSRPRKQAPVAEASLELLEFRLAQESYALETRHVREVYPLKDLTPLPCTPPFVLGIVNSAAFQTRTGEAPATTGRAKTSGERTYVSDR